MKKKENTLEQKLKKKYYKAYYKFEKKFLKLIIKTQNYEWSENIQDAIHSYNDLDWHTKKCYDHSLKKYMRDNVKKYGLCGVSVLVDNLDQYTINLYNFIHTFDAEQDYIISVVVDIYTADVGEGKNREVFDYVKHIKLNTKTTNQAISTGLEEARW